MTVKELKEILKELDNYDDDLEVDIYEECEDVHIDITKVYLEKRERWAPWFVGEPRRKEYYYVLMLTDER